MASSAEKSGEGGQEAENEADDDEEEEEEEEGSDNEDEKGEGGTASVDREPRSVALGSVSMSETPRYGAPAQQTHGQVPLEALDSALSKLTANAERLLPVIAKKGDIQIGFVM
jgi:cobalamin biosynthesis protein CobT